MTVKNFEEAAKALTAQGVRVFFHRMELKSGQVELARGSNDEFDLIVWDGFGRAYVNADAHEEQERLITRDGRAMLGMLYEVSRCEKLDITFSEG